MHVREQITSEHANLTGIPNDRCSRARLRMRCVVLCTGLWLVPVLGEHNLSLMNKLTVIAPPSIVVLVPVRVVLLFTCMPSCVYDPTLTPPSLTPSKEKTFVGKNNLAGVPDNLCNSSACIRMECVMVPSWPLPGISFQVNIATLANSDFSLPSGGNCC